MTDLTDITTKEVKQAAFKAIKTNLENIPDAESIFYLCKALDLLVQLKKRN